MERRPLLQDLPSTYNALDDGECASDTSTLAEPEDVDSLPLNKFSKADVRWILAGLWSAVFLGALDGNV
jgi:hypothetical protein